MLRVSERVCFSTVCFLSLRASLADFLSRVIPVRPTLIAILPLNLLLSDVSLEFPLIHSTTHNACTQKFQVLFSPDDAGAARCGRSASESALPTARCSCLSISDGITVARCHSFEANRLFRLASVSLPFLQEKGPRPRARRRSAAGRGAAVRRPCRMTPCRGARAESSRLVGLWPGECATAYRPGSSRCRG